MLSRREREKETGRRREREKQKSKKHLNNCNLNKDNVARTSGVLYLFSGAGVTNYHKLRGLKQKGLIPSHFRRPEVQKVSDDFFLLRIHGEVIWVFIRLCEVLNQLFNRYKINQNFYFSV